MLEIDYSLIPLSGEDRKAVDTDVAAQLSAGVVPKIEKSHFGRVVVLNPDPVQTTHQVPDDLRAHLRRIMQHTTEGQIELRPERLLRELLQPEEPLHVLIIEFKTKFTHMAAFLDCIPQLRQRYPDLGVFLHTSQATALERLPELMSQKNWLLQLCYPDARGTIEITDPAELAQVASNAPELVTFSTPFFSQIRLKLPESKELVAYNLDTLRTLSSRYGVGKTREVEIGGRKEKVIVVDLPARIIRDFQFRQNRGIDFQGVVMEGRKILSRDFEKRKLELRWVGLRSLDGLIHQMPGKEARTAQVSSMSVMRVNTFNGEVSIIFRGPSDQISLRDVGMLGFRKLPGKNGAGGPAPGEGRIADAGGLCFDRLILSEDDFEESDPVQEAVRLHFYGRRLRGDMERRRKLEIYTRRITVGAVGPLAGQTLKILRRHGLEKLIDAKSFHYLCDLPQQLPQYFNTPARFEAHFTNLVKSLATLMTADGADEMRLRDCTHHMPITHEWIDAREVLFEQVNSQQLETVYRELQVLKEFIGNEFRRNFEIGKEDLAFFNKIHGVEAAALRAKWMADYKRNAYGPPLPQDDLPDFVFFGTPADKAENDASYFFPSFACTELVTSEKTAKLFSKVDYEFSVFLEERMALAEHHYREQGQTGIGSLEYGVCFDVLAGETRKGLDRLKADLVSLDSIDSPEYQALLREEEQAFRARYQNFLDEQEQVKAAHEAAAADYLRLVDALSSELNLPARPAAAPGEGGLAETAEFELAVSEAANRELQNKMILLHEQLGGVLKGVLTRVTGLESAVSDLEHTMRTQQEQVKLQALAKQAAEQARVRAKADERRATLTKLPQGELGGLTRRVGVQLAQYSEERLQLGRRMEEQDGRMRQILHAMHDTLSKSLARLQELEHRIQPAKSRVKRAQIASHLAHTERVFTSLRSMAERVRKGNAQSEQFQVRSQKLATHLYTLRLESALIQSILENTGPALPTPADAPAQSGAGGESHEAFASYRRRLDSFAGGLGAATAGLNDVLAEADGHLLEFEKAYARIAEVDKFASHKERLRLARIALDERRRLMEADLEDLPRRVRERFMPARKELLLKVFIPEVERRMLNLRRAKIFLEEVFRLDHQLLQHEYLDRAVYRRFSSNQFLRGAYIAVDNQLPSASGLQNVLPAVNRLFRTLHFNYTKQHPDKAERAASSHLKTMGKNTLLDFVQQWSAAPEKTPYEYMVLPASLELAEAVEVMNLKDRAFYGVPRLVLIYVSKFSTSEILEDPALREGYFRAQKHNVIVNIDGHAVVDNPLSICHRLLQETLGSCFDTPSVEELPEDVEQKATFRV